MQFPESWLREFCDPPLSTAQLAELLTMSGMEVEDLRPAAPPFTRVVVGEIVECEPHPNADKLSVCRVQAGAFSRDGALQIVCGAPNARVGLRAPLALVGARLPGTDGKALDIQIGKLRGVESFGMLCSARELGLSDDHGGLLELDAQLAPGADVREALKLDDMLFTLKLTPNLGHCLSVYGVAREVAALTGAPLRTPAFTPVTASTDDRLPVRVEATDLCGRFSGRVVRDINPRAKTPAWMVDRLMRCGQRPVNALVDISNYVMFEFGRPSHIFDFDKIHERLVVRWGRSGETLELLNGQTIELDASVGVIADAHHVESLAGIMGGEATAVSNDTRNVYIEAAFWWPDAVAGRSRRFGFATDAGHRFERGVDASTTVEHIERITALVQQICGGKAGPMDDQQPNVPQRKPLSLRISRASKVIGMPVTQEQCIGVFRRLGFEPSATSADTVSVMPPPWRFDLTIEEDLIEEVIRVVGYNKLPLSAPLAPVRGRPQIEGTRNAHMVRRALAQLGYQETISFSFVEERWERELAGNEDPIRVLNPIAAPLAAMRSSLIGSLVDTLRRNLAQRADRVRVFEIGRVYRRDAGVVAGDRTVAGIDQPMRLGGLSYGDASATQWGRAARRVDFHDVKGDLESLIAPLALRCRPAQHPALHPGRSTELWHEERRVGVLGELHPRWRQAYELPHAPIVFELELDAVLQRRVPVFAPMPRQQPVQRDQAFVVSDGVAHDQLIAALLDDPSGVVRRAVLFDLYRPKGGGDLAPGEHSMAVRLELLDDALTLTDERIEAALAAARQRALDRVGARLRT